MTETPNAEAASATAPIEFPAVARDLAARALKSAQARAETLNASAVKATAQIESGLNAASATLADASRNLQGAIYDDVKATLDAVEKIAAARSLAEAAQLHVGFLGERSQIGIARLAKASEYLTRAVQDGARSAQNAIARMAKVDAPAA